MYKNWNTSKYDSHIYEIIFKSCYMEPNVDGKNVISNKQYLQRAGGSVKMGKSNLNRVVAVAV